MRKRTLSLFLTALILGIYSGCCTFHCRDAVQLQVFCADSPSGSLGQVTGMIIANNGEPLIGRAVTLKGINIKCPTGAATDIDGLFVIPDVPLGPLTLFVDIDCKTQCGIEGHRACQLAYPIIVMAHTTTHVVLSVNCTEYDPGLK